MQHFYAIIEAGTCTGVMEYHTDEAFPTPAQNPAVGYVSLTYMDLSRIGKKYNGAWL